MFSPAMNAWVALLPALLIASPASFAGPRDSGGGDPLEISAVAYPDQAGLKAAIDLALSKVDGAPLPDSAKTYLAQEIRDLDQAGKFKYIPALILMGHDEGMESYTLPGDADRFLSLGGMTRLEKGESVYFSERVTHYDSQKFAELIVHEALHHTISLALSRDEDFIEDLAQNVINDTTTPSLQTALHFGIYVHPGMKISLAQFLDSLRASKGLDAYKDLRGFLGLEKPFDDRPYILKSVETQVSHELKEKKDLTFSEMKLETLYDDMVYAINPALDGQDYMSAYNWITRILATYAQEVGFANPVLKGQERLDMCKKHNIPKPTYLDRLFGRVKCVEYLTVGEFFQPAQ